MHFYESSIITTKDGLHCQVYGNEHPKEAILVKPKYIPTDLVHSDALQYRFISSKRMNRLNLWADKKELNQYLNEFKAVYPQYIYQSSVHQNNRLLFAVPIDDIERIYFPRRGLKELMDMPWEALDDHLKQVHEFVKILLQSGLRLKDLGITYSTLMGHYLSNISDINIVVYGKENYWKLMDYLEILNHPKVRWKNQEEWLKFYQRRDQFINFDKDLFLEVMLRKKSEGYFNNILFVIFATEKEEEVWFKWGEENYREIKPIIIEAEISNHLNSVVRPGSYEIKNAKCLNDSEGQYDIKQVVFYSRSYGMIAYPGEKIEVSGILEEVTPKQGEKYHRVVVGYFDSYLSDRREKEYIKVTEIKEHKQLSSSNKSLDEFEDNYKKLILEAELVGTSPVKGCQVLRNYGYLIWERIKQVVDLELKKEGYQNMYFPLFIPRSLLEKQPEHYQSFIKETINCTKSGDELLKEEMLVRPTSETIIYPTIKSWIKTEQDLPIKINQWCSIVRWEILKPNFPLIRDNEFLWQESHSLHSTEEECDVYVKRLYDIQKDLLKNYLAIPFFEGLKPERRKFAGAKYTLALESMMKNCKSIQIATSHSLGQNFSQAFDLNFKDNNGNTQLVWQACSGLTTRLLGGLVMMHSDERGLVLPPKIAPFEIAVIDDLELANKLKTEFRIVTGKNSSEWIIKGVPLIIEKKKMIRRDNLSEVNFNNNNVSEIIKNTLIDIQEKILETAIKFKEEHILQTEDYSKLKEYISTKKGFCYAPWCGDTECSNKIRKESLGSLRVINKLNEDKKCICCNKPATYLGLFGQSY